MRKETFPRVFQAAEVQVTNDEGPPVDELLEGSISKEEKRGCDSEEWHEEKDWWEETLGEAERKTGDREIGMAELEGLLPVSRNLHVITDKMIQAMDLLEKRTWTMEARLEVTEIKMIKMKEGKPADRGPMVRPER
jgi:hypothetical protein